MDKTLVSARTPSGFEDWIVHSSDEEPWVVVAESADGRSFEGRGQDLFRALQQVCGQLETEGVRLCCNGARVNARPSPAASGAGGGMVYLLPALRNPTMRDLVPLLSPAPCERVGTVEEQEEFWRRRQARSWQAALRQVNPLTMVGRRAGRFLGIPRWRADVDGDVTRWRRVGC
ncbi:hypothetical protein [Streptomyces sp. NPDC046862]|uniref:hypothetical protein n=1 Tax=Streptomyces sp. NPDC046862 TaxID=3154603 RepID=UPI003453B02D